MNSAIQHNNRGISLLQNGHHEEALTAFKYAAQDLFAITQQIKDHQQIGDRKLSQGQSDTSCTPCRNPVQTESLFIRSTPIILCSSKTIFDQCHCTIESAAVLLNMAITYHLNSEKPNCMKDALQNAVVLYDMAYGLCLRIHEDMRSNEIILIALNNLGQIHFEIGEYQKSQIYFDDLATYLMFLGPAHEHDADNGRRECILNAMVLRNPSTSAAAA